MSVLETVGTITSSVINRVLGDDILDQLKTEHREVQSLLEKAKSANLSERKSILSEIEANLVPHARGEEKTLYSVMHERLNSLASQDDEAKQLTSEAMDLTNEAYEEHHAVDMLLSELKDTRVDDETWVAKLTVIKENLDHHIKEEEEELFENAKELLSMDERQELLEAYLKAKEQFSESLPTQSQISERTPSTEASHLV